MYKIEILIDGEWVPVPNREYRDSIEARKAAESYIVEHAIRRKDGRFCTYRAVPIERYWLKQWRRRLLIASLVVLGAGCEVVLLLLFREASGPFKTVVACGILAVFLLVSGTIKSIGK